MFTPDFAIRARHLHYSFGGVAALRGIDLDLPWGSVAVIAGPNGAGKSTLLEILAGVRRPGLGAVKRAAGVSLVVQRVVAPDALPVTVGDVVAMGTWGSWQGRRGRPGAGEQRELVAEALVRVDLDGLASRPFNQLSGGQRQRALLAQGIARRSSIFLLDEPAAGLDSESRERTQTILAAEARRGAAVACVSHDDESIAAADMVIRLDGGRLVP